MHASKLSQIRIKLGNDNAYFKFNFVLDILRKKIKIINLKRNLSISEQYFNQIKNIRFEISCLNTKGIFDFTGLTNTEGNKLLKLLNNHQQSIFRHFKSNQKFVILN